MDKDQNERRLSDSDVAAIIAALNSATGPGCKCVVDPDTLKEAVEFFQNINQWFDGTKRTIWNTLLVAAVLGIIGIFSLGLWQKLPK